MSKFKLLVITSIEQRIGGGSAVAHTTLEFDTKEEADIAHSRIQEVMPAKAKLTAATKTDSIRLY